MLVSGQFIFAFLVYLAPGLNPMGEFARSQAGSFVGIVQDIYGYRPKLSSIVKRTAMRTQTSVTGAMDEGVFTVCCIDAKKGSVATALLGSHYFPLNRAFQHKSS